MKKQDVIYCSNCLQCKVFLKKAAKGKKVERRVKCKKGLWKTATGHDKDYPYHTVLRRVQHDCIYYDSMGETDLNQFLADLKKSLPATREFLMPPKKFHEEARTC